MPCSRKLREILVTTYEFTKRWPAGCGRQHVKYENVPRIANLSHRVACYDSLAKENEESIVNHPQARVRFSDVRPVLKICTEPPLYFRGMFVADDGEWREENHKFLLLHFGIRYLVFTNL